MAIAIRIEDACRSFGEVRALDGVSLEIAAGEFFTLLGSSGSGKSTLIKILGGFDRPDNGRVLFDGAEVTDVPANRRPVNTVFQDLALFPHMNVAENVSYGLRIQRVSQAERRNRMDRALTLVGLEGFEGRDVNLLSGGQRQRVALARALIMEPGGLLLDEPLTGLDERLRQQMRDEFGRLHERTGATFVLVTHNQDEALSLSDRMAVMHEGRLEQVDTPASFFEAPANAFVARFMGMDAALVPDRVERNGVGGVAWVGGQPIPIARVVGDPGAGVLAFRPDQIGLADPGGKGVRVDLCAVRYRGLHYDLDLALADGQRLVARVAAAELAAPPQPGAALEVAFKPGAPVLVADESGPSAAFEEEGDKP